MKCITSDSFPNHNQMSFLFAILLLLTQFVPNTSSANEEEVSLHPQYVLQDNLAEYTGPCHLMHLRYADRYPAGRMLDEGSSALFLSGKIGSSAYLGARFKSLKDVGKGASYIAFRNYSEFNFTKDVAEGADPTSEYVGHVRLDVRIVEEIYNEKAHGSWDFVEENSTHTGFDLVKPERFQMIIGQGSVDAVRLPAVRYELCKVRWFIDARLAETGDLNGFKTKYPDFPFEATGTHLYPEYSFGEGQIASTPTVYGYDWRILNHEDFNWELLKAHAIIIGVSALPIIGTIDSIIECSQDVNTMCVAQAGFDVASDALMVGKLFKVGNVANKIANASSASGRTCKVAKFIGKAAEKNWDLKAVGVGNITLAGMYASRGEYLNAIAAAAAGSSDIVSAVLINRKAFHGGTVGLIPKKNCVPQSDFSLNIVQSFARHLSVSLDPYKVARAMSRAQQLWPGKGGQMAEELLEDLSAAVSEHNLGSLADELLEIDGEWSKAVTAIRGIDDFTSTIGTSGVKEGSYYNFFKTLHPELKQRIIDTSGVHLSEEQFLIAGQRIDVKIAELRARGISCSNTGNDFDIWSFITEDGNQVDVLVDGGDVIFSREKWNMINCSEVDAMNKWLNAEPGRSLSDEKIMATLDSTKLGSKVRCTNCSLNFPESENLLILEDCKIQ